ncbi:Succinylglutamate desuccinylase [Allorhodopirellula solitaria]|uniref:Succinylglutamate desuccinylase n=2 Tax=Allorhodopirellula solitaria TaxID=2527987 RepID=A0A5C5XSH7_9BACT|nr:Succinylglutamate desuccinylase [Allorhodopirellula solitaria]
MTDVSLFESREFGGDREGPRLLITAGIHGDEYLPMLAVKELIDRFDASLTLRENLQGTVTLIPIANQAAYERGHRCGLDNIDLARVFPGKPDGNPTQQLACELSDQIRKSDFYIDLHTGGTELCVLPLAGYTLHREPSVLEQQRQMAVAFGLPFVWGTSADLPGRSLSLAGDSKVPAIYVEYLGAHRELAEALSGAAQSQTPDHPLVSGCLNVMRHLGMLPEIAELPPVACDVVEDERPEAGHMQVAHPAPTTGFLVSHVELGQSVVEGGLLAEIVDATTQTTRQVLSQQNGRVIVIRDYPRINQGDAVAVVVESGKAE